MKLQGNTERVRLLLILHVCAGPKNYAYRVINGKQKCKIRGFTLNYKNSQILNFDTMKDMVANLDDRV